MKSITKFNRNMLNGKHIKINLKEKCTSYEYHWHDYYEIILYLNCFGECTVNETPYKIDNNCLFLVTPKDFHGINTVDKDDAVSINLSFSEQIVDPALLPYLAPIYIESVSKTLIEDIYRLYNCYRSSAVHRDIYLKSLFNCILIDICSQGKIINENVLLLNPLIQKAITIVITTPEKKHSVQSLSKELGVSADYFSHLFAKETGITFTKYLNEMRIDHAKRLLESTDLSVLEIAFEAGFGTPAHFHKIFKSATALSPGEYRASKKQNNLQKT